MFVKKKQEKSVRPMRVPDLIVRVISSAWIATTIIIKPRAGTLEGDARQLLFLLKGVRNCLLKIFQSHQKRKKDTFGYSVRDSKIFF